MYKIVGADQKEYGPVTADQLRMWIAEGRVNAHTSTRLESGADWKPLSEFPEFADALGVTGSGPLPASSSGLTAVSVEDILARDYELDIGGCISRGWNLLKSNFGLLFCGVLIYMAIEGAIALLGAIPFIGPLFSIANIFVVGPLLGGLYYLTLQAIRRRPAGAGDVFAGFRTAFMQLFLGQLVSGILAGLCVIPAVIVGVITILPSMINHHPPGTAQVLIVVMVFLVCLIPVIFLKVNWIFTLPLIIDKRMTFWPAMQTSWKMVRKHWWQIFGLVLLIGLLNFAGALLCCVGVLFTTPIGISAMMYAYETIFSSDRTQAA